MWDKSHDAKLIALWQTNRKVVEIAREIGFSAAYISLKSRQLALIPRKLRHTDYMSYLVEESNKRGMSVRALRQKILKVVTEDHLINAILDDNN